jgi:hypothetical protein
MLGLRHFAPEFTRWIPVCAGMTMGSGKGNSEGNGELDFRDSRK